MVHEGDAVEPGRAAAEPDAVGAHAGDDPGPGPQVPGYELGRLLARGGTSEVWAAVALDGGRRVAVKLVHADLGALEAAAREAAVSARAASAHVVAVEACVELADGRVAVVMPHLRGGALDAVVRARGHLSPGEVVTVLAPVASALGRLHDLGVVHGDVSPGNVLLELDGRPVLGDLGLGHVVGEVSPGVWGTDGYVAPEVLLGGDPTPASDVYALGALGWLCLSGTVPGPPGLRPELAEVSRAGEGSEPVVAALAAAVSADPADRPGAHELAWLLFGAAEPEPLRLVHGDDEVSAVTYRLRAAAGRPPVVTASGPWWRSTVGRVLRWLPRRPSGHPAAGSARGARHAGGDVRRGWGLVTGAGAGVAGRWWRPRPWCRCSSRCSWSRSRCSAAPATGPDPPRWWSTRRRSRSSPPTAPTRAPTNRRRGRDPPQLLGVLADARAAAWREATPALLHAADAPGSAAARARCRGGRRGGPRRVALHGVALHRRRGDARSRRQGTGPSCAPASTPGRTPSPAPPVPRHDRPCPVPRCSSTWCTPTSAGGCPTCGAPGPDRARLPPVERGGRRAGVGEVRPARRTGRSPCARPRSRCRGRSPPDTSGPSPGAGEVAPDRVAHDEDGLTGLGVLSFTVMSVSVTFPPTLLNMTPTHTTVTSLT